MDLPTVQGWERLWADGVEESSRWRQPDPAVMEWAGGLAAGARLLDLGCGVGRHSVALARLGLQVVAADIAPSGLAACASWLARERLPVRLARHDIAHLPFADGAFDALLSFHVIYHTTVAGLRAALGEVRRVVRPGGALYLTFVGRVAQRMARYRADVARGICQEPEPFTFVYVQDAPDDKDLLHHYSDEAEVGELLRDFIVESLVPVQTRHVDPGLLHPVGLHYHVRAWRPR